MLNFLKIQILALLLFTNVSSIGTPYHWECGTFTVDATDTLIYCPQISTNYIYFTITNTGTSDIYVRQIINSTNLPAGWSFNMCNPNGCWGPNVLVDTFPVPASSNVIARFDFHCDTAIGSGIASVRFDDSASPAVNGATFNLHATSQTPLSVSVFATGTNICAGDEIYLSAIASGGDGNYTYTWLPNIGSSPGPLPYTPTITTTIMVIITDGIGTPAATDTVTITVNPMPIALFMGNGPGGGCVPLYVCFIDSSVVWSGTITQWLWDFGDGTPPDTNQNPCHVYTVPSYPNFYSVTLTATSNAGCSSSFTLNNYAVTFPVPSAAFTATPQYVLINQLVQFTSTGDSTTTWHWDFGDGDQSNIQNPVHMYYFPGNYLVCLTATTGWGCADTVCDSVYVVTGIEEMDREHSISIFPNPASDELKIQNAELRIEKVEIYNSYGENVFSQSQTTNYKLQTVDVSQLHSGIYFVRVRGESGERIRRFIKQ